MRAGWVPLGMLAACYAPHIPIDVPCSATGECPVGQVCDHQQAVPTCVEMIASVDATPPIDAGTPPDSGPGTPDGPPGLGPWGSPTMVPISITGDDDPTLTGDMLELYFDRLGEIYTSSRPDLAAAWTAPVVVAALASPSGETTPEITLDGLTIYFTSSRSGAVKIWMSTRPSRADAWGAPALVPSLNSLANDVAGAPSADGLAILLASTRGGASYDIYTSTRPTVTAAWSTPTPIAPVNSPYQDESPFFGDALSLYLDADRLGTGNYDLYVSTRPTASDPFGVPQPIPELTTPASDYDPWVSPDGHHMYFASNRSGTLLLWHATR